MVELKNIYKEIIKDIKNMTDKQMIAEMVQNGCIFVDKNKNTGDNI